jgi:hypothetical protein
MPRRWHMRPRRRAVIVMRLVMTPVPIRLSAVTAGQRLREHGANGCEDARQTGEHHLTALDHERSQGSSYDTDVVWWRHHIHSRHRDRLYQTVTRERTPRRPNREHFGD